MTQPLLPRPQSPRVQEQLVRNRKQRAIGQVADASTETTLYTCPVQRIATGCIYWAERAGGTPTISVRLQEDGAADDNKQYLITAHALAANEYACYPASGVLILGPTDSIEVLSSDANVTFVFNGYTEPQDAV